MLRRYIAATGSYDFPVGNGASYQLANINFTGGTPATYIDVNFNNPSGAWGSGWPLVEGGATYDSILHNGGTAPGTSNTYGGIWRLTPDAGSPTYDLTLNGRNFGYQFTNYTIVKRTYAADPNPNVWTLPGTLGTVSSNSAVVTCTRTNITGFSEAAIATEGTPLPVNLISYNGTCINDKVTLNWSTASESNNDFFTIERSSDAQSFTGIGVVKGAGNSSTLRNYSYSDPDPLAQVSYYRLKQTDYNGQSELFPPIKVNCDESGSGFTFNVTSNLLNDGPLQLNVQGASDEPVLVVLTDVLGKQIYSKMIVEKGDNYLISIRPDQRLPAGMYFITASNKQEYISHKIVVK